MSESPPRLRVVHGDATAEETAALVVVTAVLAARRAGAQDGPQDEAADPAGRQRREAALRRPLSPGPGAWLASARIPGARTRAGR